MSERIYRRSAGGTADRPSSGLLRAKRRSRTLFQRIPGERIKIGESMTGHDVFQNPETRRVIAGAISRYFAGGQGPGHSSISSTFALAGYEEPPKDAEGNKERRVLMAIRKADPETAQLLVEEVLSLLRSGGYFDSAEPATSKFVSVLGRCGILVSDDGFLDWTNTSEHRDREQGSPLEVSTRDDSFAPSRADHVEVPVPTVDLLEQALRRLPSALRPLVVRRRHRRPFEVRDEYDVQDAVESVLRALYVDVRPEERTPSYAGSSSVMDFLLRRDAVAVEVKVTSAGRTDRQIKPELLVDFEDYRQHPSVNVLLAVVYDMSSTIANPAGFESDLSGDRHGIDIRVIVVGWPLPSLPPGGLIDPTVAGTGTS